MMPREEADTGRLALSTYRVDGLNDNQKEGFGREWVHKHLGEHRSLKAHCELPVRHFESLRLRTEFDNSPPRHVNILGWPVTEEDQLEIATDLCVLIEDHGRVERYSR